MLVQINLGGLFFYCLKNTQKGTMLYKYYFFFFLEEVIWRKLLIDGDGIGDDRRLNILLKTYLKWCNTKYTDPVERYFYVILIQ